MPDTYLVPLRPFSGEIKEKGSRFIGEVIPVSSEAEAEAELERVRKREYNATHHCFGYRIGPDALLRRSSDDGEPSGTAGAPIMRQIEAQGVTNVLVVVTRYYGGTKLGTGGLQRAYAAAAQGALEGSSTKKNTITDCVVVEFEYPDTSAAMLTIERFDGHVSASEYAEATRLDVRIARSRVDEFVAAFVEALSGRGRAARNEEERQDAS